MGGSGPVQVEVLGPLRVVDAADVDITPSGAMQRRLLALLVLRRDQVVTADRAIDVLWPSQPPRDPLGALHNQVSRLRKALPELDIASRGDGYLLASARLDVDADRLAGAVHAGDSASLEPVLARWRGSAYPELADADEGRVEAARLEELRVRARELWAEHRLVVGGPADVVPELAALVDEHPLREVPVSLLMDALDRAGRRAEALRAYDAFRRRLGEELGIEPSPALAARHAAMLSGAEAPDVPVSSPTPPLSAPGASVRRLPVPATRIIGRDTLLRDAVSAVGAHRVVSLVGPGGVGKTRLAIELGHVLPRSGDRPVAMIGLNATPAPVVVERVAAELGIEPRAGVDLVDRIADVLAGDPLVLVLDGCEHALDPIATLVERVVAACPGVAVVATSQERLRVPGEKVLPVPSLPSGGGDPGEAPAVALFVERARAAAPAVELTEGDLATVAEVTRRLDGLPLAIELAAARLHTHSLAEVAAGLDERFSLLSAGYRSSIRHGSLRAAVSWSYELLDGRLRQLLTQLSVFAGSFTVTDVAAVCRLDPPVTAIDLAQLAERSLATRTDSGRYCLLETLRAFGAEQLRSSGQEEAVRRRHAEHYVTWMEERDRRLADDGPNSLLTIEAAVPDLRAALDHLLAVGRVDLASRLMAVVRDFAFFRPRPDVLAWADRVTDADPDGHAPAAPRVAMASAYAAWMAGDVAGSASRAERALALAEAAGGPIHADVLTVCGTTALVDGRLDEAIIWYRRAAAAATESGDPSEAVYAAATELLARAYAGDPSAPARADRLVAEVGRAETTYSAYTFYCAGEAALGVDDDLARVRLTRAVELAERTGASFVTGLAGASRASIEARVGDAEVAAAEYRWLIPHWRRAGVWSTQWTMLRSIAMLLGRLGRWHEAAVLEGAVRATDEGHRIFGADEQALASLAAAAERALGGDAYREALGAGAALDGDAAASLALRALG